jgi:hypothetical protein
VLDIIIKLFCRLFPTKTRQAGHANEQSMYYLMSMDGAHLYNLPSSVVITGDDAFSLMQIHQKGWEYNGGSCSLEAVA